MLTRSIRELGDSTLFYDRLRAPDTDHLVIKHRTPLARVLNDCISQPTLAMSPR